MFQHMFQAKFRLLLSLLVIETLKHLILIDIESREIREIREKYSSLTPQIRVVHTRARETRSFVG